MHQINPRFSFLLLILPSLIMQGQELVVAPYLQDATPNSIHIMWETSEGGTCEVLWGTTRELSNQTEKVFSMVNERPSEIHRVKLEGLSPATTYFYRVTTGLFESSIYHFTTPPLPGEETSFQFLAMSDMQRDDDHPDKFKETIEEGVLPYLTQGKTDYDLSKELATVLIPGDLVVEGLVYTDWTNDFFRQSAKLLPFVPVYPVLGNHERNSDFYFKYFHLPDNGTPGYMEHWYYKDYGNMRIIGLNSNDNYRLEVQLDWLDDVLKDAAQNDHIDFVFAQLHHPYKSELWIAGERDFTGEVITLLEKFSTRTGKPSIHFYGHTHGYARGQSRDHKHLWVNVATAGGRIDGWGEYAQRNYDEFSVSRSDYGFVLVEVTGGEDPTFELKRVSRGDLTNPKDNEVNDVIKVKRYDEKPERPACVNPNETSKQKNEAIFLTASAFKSVNGSEHGATQWQVSRTYSFAHPDVDIWRHFEDWYGGKDLNQGLELTELNVTSLREKTTYYWRVRYRTKGLVWSDWSETQKFVVE